MNYKDNCNLFSIHFNRWNDIASFTLNDEAQCSPSFLSGDLGSVQYCCR
jgi:hypothetical protein